MIFLSTLSLRRATTQGFSALHYILISIHALLAESDLRFSVFNLLDLSFLSTLSLRRATYCSVAWLDYSQISIHALLAESDPRGGSCYLDNIISIHALLAESDSMMPSMGAILISFLSTLSLRRATKIGVVAPDISSNFYPRSPCGERRKVPLLGIK